jgi:hypothetical protein
MLCWQDVEGHQLLACWFVTHNGTVLWMLECYCRPHVGVCNHAVCAVLRCDSLCVIIVCCGSLGVQ